MFNPPPDIHETLKRLNAGWRMASRAPTYKETEGGKSYPIDQGHIYCEIFDLTLDPQCRGKPYASAKGETEPEALKNAVAAALVADKPLTPAQAATQSAQKAAAKTKEAEDLRKQLDEANKKLADAEKKLADSAKK